MVQFFVNGGMPMIFVVIFGLIALAAAIRFAMVPDAKRVGSVVSLSLAVLASTITGEAADLAMVGHAVSRLEDSVSGGDIVRMAFAGFSESMSPVILGFALLSVIWLVMAVGYRRLAPRSA